MFLGSAWSIRLLGLGCMHVLRRRPCARVRVHCSSLQHAETIHPTASTVRRLFRPFSSSPAGPRGLSSIAPSSCSLAHIRCSSPPAVCTWACSLVVVAMHSGGGGALQLLVVVRFFVLRFPLHRSASMFGASHSMPETADMTVRKVVQSISSGPPYSCTDNPRVLPTLSSTSPASTWQ